MAGHDVREEMVGMMLRWLGMMLRWLGMMLRWLA